MSRREDEDPPEPASPPAPYPIDEVLEEAYSQPDIEPAPLPICDSDFDESRLPAEPEEASDDFQSLIKGLPPWQQKFCYSLLQGLGSIPVAAMRARISVRKVKLAREESEVFDFCVQEIIEYCGGIHETALIRLATVGEVTPIYQGGFLVGHKRVKDVRALEFLLSKTQPERYGDKSMEGDNLVRKIVEGEAAKATLKDAMQRLYGAKEAIDQEREKVAKARVVA